MAGVKVRLDHKGIAEIAKGPMMQRAMRLKADQVARGIRSMGIRVGGFQGDSGEIDLPVEVLTEVSDRARAEVILAHPAGQAVQAKRGALTKAAAQAGLEVKDKK